MTTNRTPARLSARQTAVRRRRWALIVVLLGVVAVGAFAYVLLPSDSESASTPISTESAIDRAARKAAANAAEGAKAADAIEQRAWAIGQYATIIPTSDGVNSGASVGNAVALTFDDGPGKDTWDVLALLKRYKMHATFFVIGQNIANNPGVIEAEVAAGHVVGDHSMTHASLPSLSKSGLRTEVIDTKRLITAAADHTPTLLRPPFGDFTGETNEFVRAQGMLPILWTVDSNDWALHDSATIAENVLNSPELKPGAIILLHDGTLDRQVTVNALPMILDGLVKRGLHSVTVPELLRLGPPTIARPGDYKLSDYAKPQKH